MGLLTPMLALQVLTSSRSRTTLVESAFTLSLHSTFPCTGSRVMVRALPIPRDPPIPWKMFLTKGMMLLVYGSNESSELDSGLLSVFGERRYGCDLLLHGEITYLSFIIILFGAL